MLGELHATFVFVSADVAKTAWERVARRCRDISVNRWSLDPNDPRQGRAVTVLAEEERRGEFEKAVGILSERGHRTEPPAYVIEMLRAKRARVGETMPDDADRVRRETRAKGGLMLGRDGRIQPARRPRG